MTVKKYAPPFASQIYLFYDKNLHRNESSNYKTQNIWGQHY